MCLKVSSFNVNAGRAGCTAVLLTVLTRFTAGATVIKTFTVPADYSLSNYSDYTIQPPE